MDAAAKLKALDLAQTRSLLEADLFDAAFYRRQTRLRPADDAFAHYFHEGSPAGLRPNIVFDPAWYLDRNPDARQAGIDPLLHYAVIGEAAGRDPSPLFDVAWYARTHAVERPLAHYLAHRFGPFSPIPEFDADYYLRAYPDVGAARMDPFVHYMHFGFREFRKPFAGFNPRLYALRHLADDRGANPIAHLRAHPGATALAARKPDLFEAVKTYAARGPRYEALAPTVAGAKPGALVLAYHLTQYHRIPENDAWWGEGYTEWTHLARGQPRFAGHYQPRIPGALGFYDLSQPDVLRAQARLAKAAGVQGFVFYSYDFDGRRLLETPLEDFLAAPDIDIGFCLMWANENWTRRWDGAEQEVLIAQTYDERYEAQRCADWARHFRDPRYIRLGGRPLMMVYRGSLIPEAAQSLARWRRCFVEQFQEDPIFVTAQCFDDVDPRPLGFHGAVEFPPHKLTKGLPQVYERLDIFDEAFEADAFAYDDLVEASLGEAPPDFPLIKTAVPSWDNDARRQGKGLTIVGSTPRKYQQWLAELIARAEARPFFGSAVVCVNAWNEWSEGAYLEPDVHYGYAYLNATARAIFGEPSPKARLARVADRPAPALVDLARHFAVAFGVDVADFADAATALAAGTPAALVETPGPVAALAAAGVRVGWLAAPDLSAEEFGRAEFGVFITEGGELRPVPLAPSEGEEAPYVDRLARALFPRLFPEAAKISVFLINRDGAPLASGLRSMLAQTHPIWEIVVLDASSSEAALAVVEDVANAADRDVSLVFDDRLASGDAALWGRAAEMASGDFVLVAEADGLWDPTFLASLAAPLRADSRPAMAFCDSRAVDQDGRPLRAAPTPFATAKRPASFADRAFDGVEFIGRFLFEGAPAPRLGATLWRREVFVKALAALAGDADFSGMCRALAAAPGARFQHVAESLSFVRAPAP